MHLKPAGYPTRTIRPLLPFDGLLTSISNKGRPLRARRFFREIERGQPERFLVIFSVDRRKHPNRLAGWVQLGKLLTQPVQRHRFAAHQEKGALRFRAFGDHDATRVNILA